MPVLQKIKHKLANDPVIPFLNISTRELRVDTKKYLYICVHSNIMHNNRKKKQLRCPSGDECVNQTWHMQWNIIQPCKGRKSLLLGTENKEVVFHHYRVSTGENEKILETDWWQLYNKVNIHNLTSLNCTFKMGKMINFMLCVFFHNKNILKF
jgi:hypothetical protein